MNKNEKAIFSEIKTRHHEEHSRGYHDHAGAKVQHRLLCRRGMGRLHVHLDREWLIKQIERTLK